MYARYYNFDIFLGVCTRKRERRRSIRWVDDEPSQTASGTYFWKKPVHKIAATREIDLYGRMYE